MQTTFRSDNTVSAMSSACDLLFFFNLTFSANLGSDLHLQPCIVSFYACNSTVPGLVQERCVQQ